MDNWFTVDEVANYLYVIRERLDSVDTRFYTTYINLFLLVGHHSALLIDTGTGVNSLKNVVEPLVGDKNLIVLNTHAHFDHVGNNHEFKETHIHKMDFKAVVNGVDVSYLVCTDKKVKTHFSKIEYKIKPSDVIVPLVGNEIFDLGNLRVEILYTPGHTPGSICLFTDKGDVFTGDTFHHGAVYLPSFDKMKFYSGSLQELLEKVVDKGTTRVFPAHEDYPLEIKELKDFTVMITKLIDDIEKGKELELILNEYSPKYKHDKFLDAGILTLPRFTLICPFLSTKIPEE